MLKTIFFGTPEVAVPFLRELRARSDVLAVVSQPDRPSGRGLKITPTPVKAAALELGLAVLQPERPSQIEVQLKTLGADLAVVVAYGRLLKRELLETTRLGFLNVHFSLLPKYRGAAPVQWCLARGEKKTGVTLFWLDEGMDTGPIQAMRETEVSAQDDARTLIEKLTHVGCETLAEQLASLEAGDVRRQPQIGEPTAAPLIKREDAQIDLGELAEKIHDRVRGFVLWPRAYLESRGLRLLVLKTELAGPQAPAAYGHPGLILAVDRDRGILVECGFRSRLWFLTVQPEGKKIVNAADFANGLRLVAGGFLPFSDKKT